VFPAPLEWVYFQKLGDKLFAQDKNQGLFTWTNETWKPVSNGNITKGDPFHGGIMLSGDSIIFVSYYNQNILFTGNSLSGFSLITPQIESEVVTVRRLNTTEYVMGTTSEGCIVFNKRGEMVQQITLAEGMQDNSIL
jgi:hypothetical protein